MRLLPDSSHAESDGALSIGGCRIDSLASQYGTPLFVHDETHIRARAREAIAEFGSDRVIYATKAFLCTAMARLIHEEGLLLDVATGGELFTVLHAGVPASRCVMHGNNKSSEELRYAMSEGVRHIVVDSFDEIDRIEALHG
ncbi:MAG: diaminopimelate decarboxylase, partial [Ilumatobacteraceae bacterium]|nr:diaminopimelate decarboxylase [Ilumatobacteraceae bacterium]